MKHLKNLFYVMLSLFTLNGCNNESINEDLFEEVTPRIESNLDKAISTATKALQEMRQTTRNNKNCSVKEIYPILSKKTATRASIADTLLYLINYDEGFAIVGAQNYTDQIFAISDNSQMDITDTIINPMLADLIDAYANFVSDDILNRSVKTTQSETIINVLEYMPPLIQSKWGQNRGFNAMFPKGEAAGCAPVAVAQVCYYRKNPQSFNGYQFDWNLMQNIKTYSDFDTNPEAGNQVSRFLYEVAQKMGTKEGSTLTANIAPCLKSMGYNANFSNLDIHIIKWGILNGHDPAIICAANNNNVGHAWVVDGYRETETKTPRSNGYDYDYQYDYYLHCNWGWYGEADGYYRYANSMGLFEFNTILGPAWGGDGSTSSYVYTKNFKMIYHIY